MKFVRLILVSLVCSSSFVASALTANTPSLNSRHVCLFKDYNTLRGPHFNALFDELLQEQQQKENCKRRIALCTSEYNSKNVIKDLLPAIQEDLLLIDETTTTKEGDSCRLFVLDEHNPLTLEQEIEKFQPSIFWVFDDDSFRIRYKMKISGLDDILGRMCGHDRRTNNNDDNDWCCLYVGENGGAISAGSSMATAHANNHNPKQSPEPQFFGLGLLGSRRSISFGLSLQELEAHPKVSKEDLLLLPLKEDQVFCWSQRGTSTTSFVFLPRQKGMLEQWESPNPVPPLVDDSLSIGGVSCRGEPSIDPSRMMQQVGDSEWINEVDS